MQLFDNQYLEELLNRNLLLNIDNEFIDDLKIFKIIDNKLFLYLDNLLLYAIIFDDFDGVVEIPEGVYGVYVSDGNIVTENIRVVFNSDLVCVSPIRRNPIKNVIEFSKYIDNDFNTEYKSISFDFRKCINLKRLGLTNSMEIGGLYFSEHLASISESALKNSIIYTLKFENLKYVGDYSFLNVYTEDCSLGNRIYTIGDKGLCFAPEANVEPVCLDVNKINNVILNNIKTVYLGYYLFSDADEVSYDLGVLIDKLSHKKSSVLKTFNEIQEYISNYKNDNYSEFYSKINESIFSYLLSDRTEADKYSLCRQVSSIYSSKNRTACSLYLYRAEYQPNKYLLEDREFEYIGKINDISVYLELDESI